MISSHCLLRNPARRFGRRQPFVDPMPIAEASSFAIGDDVRLFLTTFVGGLLFVTVYLA
jgi:hypothetical protein